VPVDLVTIHHEAGAGKPPTDDVWRFSEGGYTYGIGNTLWQRFRSVSESYATLNYNHVSLDICLSSDRHTVNDVTDAHLALIHDAFMDSYNRGEVTAQPLVRAHRNSPGSATACPGDFTMARWAEVASACSTAGIQQPEPPQPEEPESEADMLQSASALNQDGRAEMFALMLDGMIRKKVRAVGGAWSDWYEFGESFDGGLTAVTNTNGCIELFAHHTERGYCHRWQTQPNNGWSDWADL